MAIATLFAAFWNKSVGEHLNHLLSFAFQDNFLNLALHFPFISPRSTFWNIRVFVVSTDVSMILQIAHVDDA